MFIELNENVSLDKLIDNSYSKTILYFSAKWCGPCKQVNQKIIDFSNENMNEFCFYKIDIDQFEELSNLCEITSLPTFMIYSNKTLYNKIEGSDLGKLFMNLNL